MTQHHNEAASCTGKARLPARRAKEAARRLRERGEAVTAYRCLSCGKWHVGSRLAGNALDKPRLLKEQRHG
jgi:ribosomal protein L32